MCCRATPMVRVTFMLQLLLLFLSLKQSDAVNEECRELQDEISGLEENRTRITEQQHEYEKFFRQCKEKENEQISISVNLSRKLNESQAVKSYLNATIDGLTKKMGELNQMVRWLCGQTKDACRYLLEAAKSGDVNTVKRWVRCSNDNCTTGDVYRNTPLIYAARNGRVEVVRVLLKGCTNVDRTEIFGITALQQAAYYGHLDVCRLLLDWGAKVDTVDGRNNTPLHRAAFNGHLSVAKLLVERGADVDAKSENFYTTLHIAAFNGMFSLVKLLLERGADVNVKNVAGSTPLHYAALLGHFSVVKLLVERRADVGLKNDNGQTASDLARGAGMEDVAEWLDSISRS